MTPPSPPLELFELAVRRAELTLRELWLRYLTLGGTCDLFEVEAFLHGLNPVTEFQQDVLALAVNERLEEIYRGARLPYVMLAATLPTGGRRHDGTDPLAVLDQLLARPQHRANPGPVGSEPDSMDPHRSGAA